MIRRTGITLIEVLMAIFVMTIGMLGLLSMFPVAAMSMMQATQDDRATVQAANATSVAQAFDLRNALSTFFIQPNPTNPNSPWPTITDPNWPSYPIFVDVFPPSGTIGDFQ